MANDEGSRSSEYRNRKRCVALASHAAVKAAICERAGKGIGAELGRKRPLLNNLPSAGGDVASVRGSRKDDGGCAIDAAIPLEGRKGGAALCVPQKRTHIHR